MKLTGIGLYSSSNNEVAFLSFRDPGSLNPYIAKSILGLDADEIVHKFYGISKVSKSKYYDMTMTTKEIVLSILLNPRFTDGKTYSDLRDVLYKGISSSRTGAMTLRFFNGLVEVAHISGFVTKLESPQFTEQPLVQLTMRCDDPMLRSEDNIFVDLTGVVGLAPPIDEDISTAPHGLQFQVDFTGPAASFTISDASTPEWSFTVTPGLIGAVTGFVVGDKLFFSSEHTGRKLELARGPAGTPRISLVDKIAPGSIWPVLFPGENQFVNTDPVQWVYISYHACYWGV